MFGLYIHIPFCAAKCAYCDFVSYANKTTMVGAYLEALQKEALVYETPKPQTVYIGGGTPSFLNSKQIESLLSFIQKQYGGGFKEFTFEVNPESVEEEKLKILKDYGVNRLSMGLQSFNDEELKLIGRVHNSEKFISSYNLARKYFDNINVDLIAALPGQTKGSFLSGLNRLLLMKPNHISLYGLQIEPGTRLYESGYSYEDDFYIDLLQSAFDILTKNGFCQYEISNYAQANRESLHNINYWQSGEYLGLGAAAGGFIKGERYQNITDLTEYISAVNSGKRPTAFTEMLSGKAKIGEEILLSFRYLKGFKPNSKMLECFSSAFKELQELGLIENDEGNLKLSKKGKYLANKVFSYFVEPF